MSWKDLCPFAECPGCIAGSMPIWRKEFLWNMVGCGIPHRDPFTKVCSHGPSPRSSLCLIVAWCDLPLPLLGIFWLLERLSPLSSPSAPSSRAWWDWCRVAISLRSASCFAKCGCCALAVWSLSCLVGGTDRDRCKSDFAARSKPCLLSRLLITSPSASLNDKTAAS